VAAELAGRIALVTGVGRAGQIGHAVAQALGRAGARLVIVDVNAAALAERGAELSAEGIEVATAAGDLTRPTGAAAAVAAATERYGGLDVVVNVAGGFFNYGPVTDVTPDKLDLELAVNFKTCFFTCQAALPALVRRGAGAIVNFASIAAVRPLTHMAAYTAAKSAVAGLTHALAREYKDANVRVNAVAPATVRTGDNVSQMGADPKTPFVEIEDVVRVVLFLAGDASRAVTGQVLPITGKAY
jgi:NAD(P)-dependent dehydrogenase (short-subunit alcohol dehydrogenase family)